MGLVRVYCPFTTTAGGTFVVQAANEPRFVVVCKVSPTALAGQVKTESARERLSFNLGRSKTINLAGGLVTLPATLVMTTL